MALIWRVAHRSYKLQHLIREYDWIRKALMCEPRGYDMMSGSILCHAHDAQDDAAVLFIETSGCLPMYGHGPIGTVTIAIEERLIGPLTTGTAWLETPAGLVTAVYDQQVGTVKHVRISQVVSLLAAERIRIECPRLGGLTMDVAYGGNFYAIIDRQEHFKGVEHYQEIS